MISLFIYRVLLVILLPLLILFLIIRSKNNKAYRQRLFERLGFFPLPATKNGIVVHAASVGEVIALKSFIEKLIATYPNLPITITSFTPTGSAQVSKLFGKQVQHGYLPLDVLPCTALFLHRLKPKMMIFMETELWPNLVSQCTKNHIKLVLINARLSQKSLTSYQKIKPLISPCLNSFDKITTQSEENLGHFLELGARSEICVNSGNLKFDIRENAQLNAKKAELSALLPLRNNEDSRAILVVASTHEGDEEIALSAFKSLLTSHPNLLLILVPRHPERFNTVTELCLAQGLSVVKRSENKAVSNEHVWILDSLGELMPILALSDIVVMGGSFSHIGGHNPLEPALFKKPVIVGHNMSNFNEIMQQLTAEKAIISLVENEPVQQLSRTVTELLASPASQTSLGEKALNVVLANQGASDKTLLQVKQLLPNHSGQGNII